MFRPNCTLTVRDTHHAVYDNDVLLICHQPVLHRGNQLEKEAKRRSRVARKTIFNHLTGAYVYIGGQMVTNGEDQPGC